MKWVNIVVFLVHAGLTVVAHSAHDIQVSSTADATTQIFRTWSSHWLWSIWVFLDLRRHQRPVSWCTISSHGAWDHSLH